MVITPDGPIGPRHSINAGIAWLARETGLPILTAAVTCDRAWRLRNWDRHLIPKPRAKLVLTERLQVGQQPPHLARNRRGI